VREIEVERSEESSCFSTALIKLAVLSLQLASFSYTVSRSSADRDIEWDEGSNST